MLLTASAVDPSAPMSLAALVAVIGLVMTWVTFGIALWRFRNDLRKTDEDRDAGVARVARRECEAFHHTEEHTRRIEHKIRTVGALMMEDEFRKRAPSFVDAAVYRANQTELDRRLARIESEQVNTTRELGGVTSQLAELNAFMRVKFGFEKRDSK